MIRSGLSGTNLPVILPDVTMLLRVMLILVAVILSLTSRCSLRRQTRSAWILNSSVHVRTATSIRLGCSVVSDADTGGCNSFTHQSLLSAETDPFRLDFQFECSRTYSHQYERYPGGNGITSGSISTENV